MDLSDKPPCHRGRQLRFPNVPKSNRGFRDNDQLKAHAAKLFASKAGENFKKFKTV